MIVEDEAIVALDLEGQLTGLGFEVIALAHSGEESLRIAAGGRPDLILMDISLAGAMDGIQAASQLRASFNIPVIFLTALTDPATLERAKTSEPYGYLVKPFDPRELRAAIEMALFKHAAEQERQTLVSELLETQDRLKAELAAAAKYVASLLPPPMTKPVSIDWRFLPSGHLGGDCLGYHHLDDNRIAFYLLDVSGHGIGAAMISVSLFNILRSEGLSGVDFGNPSAVLTALNRHFQMSQQGSRFFTMGYGVLRHDSGRLLYSCGGHPAAVVISPDGAIHRLKTNGVPIGCVPQASYENVERPLAPGDTLYLFSDGAYELRGGKELLLSFAQFEAILSRAARESHHSLDLVLAELRTVIGRATFSDDVSLLELRMPPERAFAAHR